MGDDVRRVAFSNGTMGDRWMANWCHRCLKDAPFRNMGKGTGCPILFGVLADNVVPPEWLPQEGIQDYHCIEFRAPGDGGGEPRPKPPPQKGPGLFPEPERAVRMLVQPNPVEVPV